MTVQEAEKYNLFTAEYYGYDAQSNMLIEECAELIQAVNKHKRALASGKGAGEAVAHIIEEMADVEIMLQQMKYLLEINPLYIDGIKVQKVKRTKKRIESEE